MMPKEELINKLEQVVEIFHEKDGMFDISAALTVIAAVFEAIFYNLDGDSAIANLKIFAERFNAMMEYSNTDLRLMAYTEGEES